MPYKLMEITTVYGKAFEKFCLSNPEILTLPYDTQLYKWCAYSFGEVNFLHLELERLGTESKIVFYNAESLQRTWSPDAKEKSLFEILLLQVRHENPDCILISDLFVFNSRQLKILKDTAKKGCLFVGFHFTTVSEKIKKILPFFDEVYTGSKFMLKRLEPLCKSTRLLYHAFEPKILEKLCIPKVENNVLFAGSIMIGCHTNRLEMLSKLGDNHIPYSFHGDIYGTLLPFCSPLEGMKYFLNYGKTRNLRHTERLLKKNRMEVAFGIPYYNILASHSVCLNQHASIAGTGSGNMRMFEATGVGACLLTDYKEENADLFVPDEEIVVYRTYDELVEKARWLLDNPVKARAIALAGQRRTLSTHTYKQKAEVLNGYLLELLKR